MTEGPHRLQVVSCVHPYRRPTCTSANALDSCFGDCVDNLWTKLEEERGQGVLAQEACSRGLPAHFMFLVCPVVHTVRARSLYCPAFYLLFVGFSSAIHMYTYSSHTLFHQHSSTHSYNTYNTEYGLLIKHAFSYFLVFMALAVPVFADLLLHHNVVALRNKSCWSDAGYFGTMVKCIESIVD